MAKLSTKDRNKLDDSEFGLPDKRAYPLNDEDHVESAVRLFGHCPDEDKPRLAKAILRRARELGMDSSGWDKVNEWANKKVDKSIQEASIIESDEPGNHKVTFKLIRDTLSRFHDKYKKDSKPPTGNQNCLLCAWCFLAHPYGKILPRPVYSPRDPALDIKPEDIMVGKIKRIKAPNKTKLMKQIHELSSTHDLEFWYCHVGWKGASGGHEFVILDTWHEGTFVIDPQQGLFADVNSKEGNKYFKDADYDRTYAVLVGMFSKNIDMDKLNKMNSMNKLIPWDNKKDSLYLLEYQGMSKDDLIWSIEQGWITVDELKELLDEGKIPDNSVKTVREVIKECESKVKQESATGINFTLKKATTRDIDFIYMCEMMTLTKREQHESKSKVNQEIMDDAKESVGHTYIIMVDGEYAGIYQGYKTDEWLISKPKGDWWYLAEIVVLPQYRGSGIGSTIIKEAMSEHDKIGLCVYEENVNAKRLYDRLGFKVTQHVDDEYGRRFIMRWERDKQRDYGDETIHLDSYKHNKVYFGSTNKVGKRLKINKQLFITPYKGIASIFAAEDPVKKKLRELKVYSSNLEYDEWKNPSNRAHKTVHVKVKIHEGQPFEKFEVTGKGYIYGIDISGLKDNIYMYPWMDKTREALIMDVDSVDIDSVDEVEVKYIVEMIGEPEKVVEELYTLIDDIHFTDKELDKFFEEFDGYYDHDNEYPDYINESDSGVTIVSDDEYDILMETWMPYDEYLKRHHYDPTTNTIVFNGRRVSAGMKGTKKQRNRMNKFLREHDWDPDTETISTDIKNPDGTPRRTKFRIDPHTQNAFFSSGPRGEYTPPYITMRPSSLSRKPVNSEQTVKHEEGHLADYLEHRHAGDQDWQSSYEGMGFNPYSRIPGEVGELGRSAADHVENNTEYNDLNTHDMAPGELLADAYGQRHNRYDRYHGGSRGLANVYDRRHQLTPRQSGAPKRSRELSPSYRQKSEPYIYDGGHWDLMSRRHELKQQEDQLSKKRDEIWSKMDKLKTERTSQMLETLRKSDPKVAELENTQAACIEKIKSIADDYMKKYPDKAGYIKYMRKLALQGKLNFYKKEIWNPLDDDSDIINVTTLSDDDPLKIVFNLMIEQNNIVVKTTSDIAETLDGKKGEVDTQVSQDPEIAKLRTELDSIDKQQRSIHSELDKKVTPDELDETSLKKKVQEEPNIPARNLGAKRKRIEDQPTRSEMKKRIRDAQTMRDGEGQQFRSSFTEKIGQQDYQRDQEIASKKRQLQRAMLQKQIESGKLTPEQIQKAKKKIQRIDEYESKYQSQQQQSQQPQQQLQSQQQQPQQSQQQQSQKPMDYAADRSTVNNSNGVNGSTNATNQTTQDLPPKIKNEYYIDDELIQEGTTYRDKHFRKLYFHVSGDEYLDGQVFKPRVPSYIEPGDTADTSTEFEDATIPRVCFSPTIEGAMNAIICKINPQYPVPYKRLAVYIPEKPFNDYKHKTNKEIIKEKLVFDASSTGEVWIMEPVRMKLFGIIEIDSYKRAKMVSNVKNNKGERSQKKYFIFKWHWLVNPKIFDDKNRPKYDVKSVITNLCYDLPKFRYGLIKNGRLDTNASDSDYNKYWVMHTGEEVDQAGGGTCWDMVEYEAGYLEAYGIPCKKYFIACQYKNKYRTHTFVVVENNGKYIYIECAFKRVVDEIGYSKEFDNLNDIFDYVLECMCEQDNVPEFEYGIFDYTDATPTVGTNMKNFQKYIADNGKLIREGTFKFKKKE